MDFLTCLILVSLAWGWEDTLETLRAASSFYNHRNEDSQLESRDTVNRYHNFKSWSIESLLAGKKGRNTYSVLGELFKELGLIELSEGVCFNSLHLA